MIVGFAQIDPIYKRPLENLQKVEKMIADKSVDLLVLPEMFSTGYLFESREDIKPFAEVVPSGPTTEKLIEIARNNNTHIVAGIVELEGEKIFNTVVVVGPNGFIGKYQKQHITPLEEKLFDRGNETKIFDVDGVSIGVVICFDSWYGEIARDLARKGAKVICSPANFGGPQSLVIAEARAIENGIYFITANRVGNEKLGDLDVTFRGHSKVIAPMGEVLVSAEDEEILKTVEIDLSLSATGKLLGADHTKELKLHYD